MSRPKRTKQGTWRKKSVKLPEHHGWTGTQGCQVFVADRGAVRFDVPRGWHIEPTDAGSIVMRDRPYPRDNCRIEMSLVHLPPDADLSSLPIDKILREVVMLAPEESASERETTWLAELHREQRDALELVWAEGEFMDPEENRAAKTRAMIARGEVVRAVQTFITMDYWRSDAAKHERVWDIVLKSLRVGEYINDPRDVRVH